MYALQYRNETGRKSTLTLGTHGSKLTPQEARGLAKEKLAAIAHGADPAADRRMLRKAGDLESLVATYRKEHLSTKKPSTCKRAEGLLKRVILPVLGKYTVESIVLADVVALHRAHRATPAEANRALTLLSHIFTWCQDLGTVLPHGNPCHRIKKYAEAARERYLTLQELARLGTALTRAEVEKTESPSAILALRLLLLTGCRKGEILSLRWEDVDLATSRLNLPDSKTGAKRVVLGAPALQLLKATERLSSTWVCVSPRRKDKPLSNIYSPWGRICKAAGVTSVRPHDMRHSFVSAGASKGESLTIIGGLVGHWRVRRDFALLAAPVAEARGAPLRRREPGRPPREPRPLAACPRAGDGPGVGWRRLGVGAAGSHP